MDDAGNRRARARADVRGGARERAGRRQAAKQRRDDVGDALREQLGVGVVPIAAHAIGDHGRQQRLDRAEHRHRHRRRQQRQHQARDETSGT